MPDAQAADASASTALINRGARLAAAVLPAWQTAFVLLSNVSAATRAIVALSLAISLASPVHGLLLVALVAPLGQLIAPLAGSPEFRISEAVVLAFLAGWLIRTRHDRRGPRMPAATAAALFAATIVASIAGLAWQLRSADPGALSYTLDEIVHLYFFRIDRIGLADGARLLEGVALAFATVDLLRARPSLAVTLPAALAVSASAAAAASVATWMRTGGYRVSAHVRDVNAAGSAFALALGLSLGMTLYARGWRRGAWLAAVAATWTGLWFSESRTAFSVTGIVVVVAIAWYAVARQTPRVRAIAIGAILAGGVAVATFRVHQVSFGADYRQQFIETSARMIAARPLFGVGIGQYYPISPLFLSPQLAWNYGFENAHNYFLQIGAELGLVGLLLFVVWIGFGMTRAARALAAVPRDVRLLGLTAGVGAFIATWTASHPLLVGEVAFPFWIQFGLMVALAGSALLNAPAVIVPPPLVPARRRIVLIATGAVVILAVTLAVGSRPLAPPASPSIDGFHPWEMASDGTRFHWSGLFASVFVPGDTVRAAIPVKVPEQLRLQPGLEVDVVVGGVFQGRTRVPGSWVPLEVTLAPVGLPAQFRRIDLRITRTWQPAIYIAGSADMRTVGIQVGEPRLFR